MLYHEPYIWIADTKRQDARRSETDKMTTANDDRNRQDRLKAARSPDELAPAALRALEEAAQRRAENESAAKAGPKEIDGRGGLDPTRYGDWEKKGIAVDF